MSKNLSERMRDVAGLHGKRHGSHLPAQPRSNSPVDMSTREEQRRDRAKQMLSFFRRIASAVGHANATRK
jgi:hypothetical protein